MAVAAEFARFALDTVASTPDVDTVASTSDAEAYADAQSRADSRARAADYDTQHGVDAFSICTVADKCRADSIGQQPANDTTDIVRSDAAFESVNR